MLSYHSNFLKQEDLKKKKYCPYAVSTDCQILVIIHTHTHIFSKNHLIRHKADSECI